jgi:spore coat protein CotF
MQEKAMVSDALNTLNSGLKTFTDMISQAENTELRSTLQQMRNETEQSQFELYQIAKNKKYYQPNLAAAYSWPLLY